MSLPEPDRQFLTDRGLPHSIAIDAGMTCVVFTGWPLPSGFNHTASDLLVRLPGGYPDVPPDMWWFSPEIRLASGQFVPATEATEQYLGRSWQRWSRHFQSGQWQSGIDGLESYLALINRELMRSIPAAA
jgi:hypothetical protein